MAERMCVAERRSRILDILVVKKQTTRSFLSEEFNVSLDTISRDIVYLSRRVPIYTKQGNNGGIFILPEYINHRLYFTKKEENCIRLLMIEADRETYEILNGMLSRFTIQKSLEYT